MSTQRQISPEAQSMSDKMLKMITIDGKTGDGKADEDLYVKLLPEDLSQLTMERCNNHNTAFVAAGLNAFSTLSLDAMVKHKNLDHTTLNIKMLANNEIDYSAVRSQDYHNPKSPGDTVTKTLVTKVKLTAAPTIDTGDFSKIKKNMAEMAMEANLAPIKK